ncbi:MAG: glycoside hydrolase family 15 protein [Acidobacteriaceae bacterium]
MALKIEDYALIGDCETAALVGKDGSIDWLCWPDFSSPACFAALLGSRKNGRWVLGPRTSAGRIKRRYLDHTLILETRFETSSGVLLLTDFMPVRETHSDIVRIVRCLHGKVAVRMELCVRFDYGRTVPWTGPRDGNAWAAAAGTGVVYLRTQQPVRTDDATATAEFTLKTGEQRSFVLTHAQAQEPPPRRINVEKALRQTEQFWKRWCGINSYVGRWKDAVERSLITLKALTYRPSGGIVAAPTTSLPERLGGDHNWDYRYCWLRDASFTLRSLLSVGYHDEARAWQDWLLQAVGSDVRGMQIMYGMRGEQHLPECQLLWLEGYEKSRPVRMGNAASEQLQLDVYGEVADAMMNMTRAGLRLDPRLSQLQRDLTDYVASICQRPTSGLWEQRNRIGHFTYSKVMAWLALEHGINSLAGKPARGWMQKRDRLHRQICRHGFNHRLGSFVQSFGSAKLDAAVLLLPIFGFLPFEDPRVRSTLEVIQKRLGHDGLIYRHIPARGAPESAFLACSFWMVENLVGVGRRAEGERLFEKLLALQNDVGLLSEEYDPDQGRLLGNFPQALSHIALINAARMLSSR